MTDELGPLDHVARPAVLWRTAPDFTECGRDIADTARVITVDELTARVRRLGQQRTSMTVCMTCWHKSGSWQSEHPHPITVLLRELQHVQFEVGPDLPASYSKAESRNRAKVRDRKRRHRMEAELEAIAVLVETYRPEFDAYVSGLDETISLVERRRRRV